MLIITPVRSNESNQAVRACGENKLAHPLFHKLEQEEQQLKERINDIRQVYQTAEHIQISERSVEQVEIGSIVKFISQVGRNS